MTLPLELGAIQDPDVRRAFEQLAQAFPIGAVNLASGLRTIRGRVNGTTGAVISGVGFTSVRNAVGDYTVTFNTAFAAIPSITVTSTAGGCKHGTRAAGSSQFLTYTTAGVLQDADVDFIAEG